MDKNNLEDVYLTCEEPFIYKLLITVGGFFGAYTFILRGGVFCNAQTANVVLFAIALGKADWTRAMHLLLPISVYFFGSFLSEHLGKTIKKFFFLRWDTLLIGIEIIIVFILGLLPKSAPDQICQVALNFICSMQFNTFRQVRGTPAATTFVTNHIRQVGSNFSVYLRKKDDYSKNKLKIHGSMIFYFILGTVLGTVSIKFFEYKSIWVACILLLIIFINLFYADRVIEREMFNRKPRGH